MAGSNRLQTEAAVITPPAKPSIMPRARAPISPRKKNTVAAPRAVIQKINWVPARAQRKTEVMKKALRS